MKNVIKANPRSRVSQFAFEIMFRGRTIEDAVSKGINRLELFKELGHIGYFKPIDIASIEVEVPHA